jgi:N-acetylmuramoyl-L-alanine amidase/Putative peptidoglycan binding domain
MKSIVISSGHGKHIRGAAGPPPWGLDEVDEARRVVDRVAELLHSAGVTVKTYHDDVSDDQNENLNRIVDFHNAQVRDLDVSVHFNAYETTSKPMGCEVLYVSQYDLANEVSLAIADAGDFVDRGPKERTDLFFLGHTEAPAILIETCFVDSEADAALFRQNFDAICQAIAGAISGEEIAPRPPGPEPEPEPVPPSGDHPTLKKGDNNAHVASLQKSLGVLIADGDFGSITDTWVRAFQAACGLKSDGIVGQETWEEIDELDTKVIAGSPCLPQQLVDQIVIMAEESEIQEFLWPDRGMTPPGYIPGMALCFAYAVRQWQEGNDAVTIMAKAQGSSDKDALAYYEAEFKKLGMSNRTPGIDTLRHLFVMMIGLGPRESSARYVEGRDLSADNVGSETCEASLFQTSWNIKSGSSTIAPLLNEFWENPNDFREQFKLDVNPTADNLNCYGSGDGVRYQWLSRFCPLFHVLVTGVGMRTLRTHWGPIGRREVTLKKEADDLLKDVQALVEGVA